MTKEVLTKENIAKDVLAHVRKKAAHGRMYFLDILLAVIVGAIFMTLASYWKMGLALFILAMACLLMYIPKIRQEALERKTALQGDFTVIKDRLSHIGEETICEPRRVGSRYQTIKSAAFLYFPCGQWRITSPNYTWSKTFYMSGQGIENTSLVGDEFYLAVLNSTGEICAVYNTKFFEYKEYCRKKEQDSLL